MARLKVKPTNIAFDVAKQILQQVNQPLNPNQMYQWAVKLQLDNQLNFTGKTPQATFGAYIYYDLRNNPNTIFEIVQTKPKLLIKLKEQNIQINNNIELEPSKQEEKSSYHERDLHPLLVNFVSNNENFYAYAKTIFHEESKKSKSGTDKWLYPDIVGVNFEYDDFDNAVSRFVSRYDKLPIKIYSFELKKELTVANFRECYFQAVSNSSWANEGYLVAAEIDTSNPELMDLMKRSNQSFGIGIIRLDVKNPAQSEILLSAQFKQKLDYTVMNELSAKNHNFKDFLKTIHDFDPKQEHRYKGEFDKVLNEEEMENYKKEKKIK